MNEPGGKDNGATAGGGFARRPLAAQPPPRVGTGKKIVSTPAPLPRDPALEPPRSRKGSKIIPIALAFVIAVVTLPYTFKFQRDRFGPITKKAYRMSGLDAITEMQAVSRFGPPLVKHDFSMTEGSVVGPAVGQKKFVALKAPDYAEQIKDAEVVWRYPQYSTVREMIWKLPDSFLTIWFHEPRAEIDLSAVGPDGEASIALPDTSHGDWITLDNFRLGNDLVKEKKGPATEVNP